MHGGEASYEDIMSVLPSERLVELRLGEGSSEV